MANESCHLDDDEMSIRIADHYEGDLMEAHLQVRKTEGAHLKQLGASEAICVIQQPTHVATSWWTTE
jgi:hypothetical protein